MLLCTIRTADYFRDVGDKVGRVNIPLIAASESGEAQTWPYHTECDSEERNSKQEIWNNI